VRAPAFPAPTEADLTTRLRLGVDARPWARVRLVAVGQGVLLAGREVGVDLGAGDPELFTGFVELSGRSGATWLRAGRQELVLGNQRLVSNNNWGQRGQRFDALRLSGTAGPGTWTVFGGRVSAVEGYAPRLGGVHVRMASEDRGQLHGYLVGTRDRSPDPAGDVQAVSRVTLGGHGEVALPGPAPGVALLGEGYVQRGRWGEGDIAAWMASAGVRAPFRSSSLELRWDLLSGDSGEGAPLRAFDRLRGSNHGFHGYADAFTRFPASTGGEGLSDLRLRVDTPVGFGLEVEVSAHRFATHAPPADEPRRLGEEVDLVLRGRSSPRLSAELGASYLRVGPALERLRGSSEDVRFLYAMMTFAF